MKNFLFVILLGFISVQAFAQKRIYGDFGSMNLTVDLHNTSALSDRLVAAGYTGLQQTQLGFGIGGGGIVSNFVFGAEGYGFGQSRSVQGNKARSFGGGAGFVDVGYVIFSSNRLLVYPTVGAGGGLSVLTLQNTAESPTKPGFDDILDDIANRVLLS